MAKMQEGKGMAVATILAIGTATPPTCFYQADYPDFYFQVTQSEHLTELKDKFKRICEKSTIKKRYMYLTSDTIKKYPNIGTQMAPSLDVRQEILIPEVPKLGKEAALKAIEEWGQPISKITHLIFSTTTGINMPGADFELVKLLGLPCSVKRFMIYQQGCSAGGTCLRLAKDIAENNLNSRVLVVCSENTTVCFRAPSETYLDILVGSAIFSDGAAAAIIGANPDINIERPLFQLISASQTLIPDSGDAIRVRTSEMGMMYYLSTTISKIIGDRIMEIMSEMFNGIGIKDWNSLFYVVHPGGPRILTQVENELGLDKEKLRASRYALSEYGNMMSVSVFFVLDEMRKNSKEQRKTTTGEGLDLGVLLAFGPGLTVESLILRSISIARNN